MKSKNCLYNLGEKLLTHSSGEIISDARGNNRGFFFVSCDQIISPRSMFPGHIIHVAMRSTDVEIFP